MVRIVKLDLFGRGFTSPSYEAGIWHKTPPITTPFPLPDSGLFSMVNGMELILSPKDNLGKMTLENVSGFALEGETLLVVFESGRTRNYPLMHLWYYESHTDFHKTEPLSKS